VNPDGTPLKDFKLVYGQAFTIYALSEFNRATGHEAALHDAIALYEKLEDVALDKVNDGYWECFSADWMERADELHTMAQHSTKSMNTHLHLIEAYTSLLRVNDTPKMRADTARHFDIMTKKVLNRESGHYYMYLNDDWTHTSLVESYGHDIEGSWLTNECAHVIGDKSLVRESEAIAALMAGACLKAVMPDGSMLDEGTQDGRFLDESRVWWIQAENVVGMLNAWQSSGDSIFLKTAYEQAMYIRRYMSDRLDGEWFGFLDENGRRDALHAAKVTGWKCPYHNARMCFEIIERYEADEADEA
jgi:mannobiose 2-epimerase